MVLWHLSPLLNICTTNKKFPQLLLLLHKTSASGTSFEFPLQWNSFATKGKSGTYGLNKIYGFQYVEQEHGTGRT